MPRYKVYWIGPWDGKRPNVRILTMKAESAKEAGKLHSKLFPHDQRRIVKLVKRKRKNEDT